VLEARPQLGDLLRIGRGLRLGGSQLLTFGVCWAAILCLAACLYNVELAGKRLDARLRTLRELLA